MMKNMKIRWLTFSLLTFPLTSGLLVLLWVWPFWTNNTYGIITWIRSTARAYIGTQYDIYPLGLMCMISLTALILYLNFLFIKYFFFKQSDIQGCCFHCGYLIKTKSDRCSECGNAHPDPVLMQSYEAYGGIHPQFLLAGFLMYTISGLAIWSGCITLFVDQFTQQPAIPLPIAFTLIITLFEVVAVGLGITLYIRYYMTFLRESH